MDVKSIENIAVIGAGTMGRGIAEMASLVGYMVTMRDINRELVNRGMDSIKSSLDKMVEKEKISEKRAEETYHRIEPKVELGKAVSGADFVIEAAPEKMELKKKIFRELDGLTPPETVLASNTSSLSVTDIAGVTSRPSEVIGMHFFNPVVRMPLVEVIRGAKTNDETVNLTCELAKSFHKTPVECKKDVPGFIVNSILIPYLNEAARIVGQGECSIREIDSAMKYQESFPMGPFELSDLIGIDVVGHIGDRVEDVPAIIEEKIELGELGRKSGKGFYSYNNGGADYKESDGRDFNTIRLICVLANRAGILLDREVASYDGIELAMKLGTGVPEGPLALAEEKGFDRVVNKLYKLGEIRGNSKRYQPADYLLKQIK